MPLRLSHVILTISDGDYYRCFPILYRKFRSGFPTDFIFMCEIISQFFEVIG